MNRPAPDLGARYAYVAIFVALAVFLAVVISLTVGIGGGDRKSVAAFFVVPTCLTLLALAAFGRHLEGRIASIVASAAFGFVPAIALGTWKRIERPIVWPAAADADGDFLWGFIAIGLLLGIVGSAPHVVRIERGLDRFVRLVAPVLLAAEIGMFAMALAHARRPDPDTFIGTLPPPEPIPLHGSPVLVGDKKLQYTQHARNQCAVQDEHNVVYTDSWGCDPAVATFDGATGVVMVRKAAASSTSPSWSSSIALRPEDIAPRLAAPVGWTHLAGGGALLASIALLFAAGFRHRARAIEDPRERPPGGYRVAAEAGSVDGTAARLRDAYEARARGARLVALTIAASTGAPLAAALAHGLGR